MKKVSQTQAFAFPEHPFLEWPISKVMKELRISIETAPFFSMIQEVVEELNIYRQSFEVKFYMGDEWFSPDGMSAIAVPFYLGHPELVDLERKMMFEVEGETSDHFKKLLRHELGHCFDHHFQYSKTREWRKIFGSPEKDYDPDFYRPRPYSKSYVNHLGNWYAQSHPDEDFAETFAVVLDQKSQWKNIYNDWPIALKKLQYVEDLLKSKTKKSKAIGGFLPYQAQRMNLSLRNYYIKKRKLFAQNYPDFFDEDLKNIFFKVNSTKSDSSVSAWNFFKRYKKPIEETVHTWTGEKKYSIHRLIGRLEDRCQILGLNSNREFTDLVMDTSAYLTAQICRYQFTGKFKRSV